jgi:hypothetical protein
LVNSDAPRDWGASGASIALNALSHASSRISWVRLPSVAAHSAAFWKVSTVAVVLGSRYEENAKTPSTGAADAPPPYAPPFSLISLWRKEVDMAWPSRKSGAESGWE